MSHTTDVAEGHETRRVEGAQRGKGTAHVPPGEGARTLWVLGELLTHKIPSHKTGGAYALFEATANPGSGPPPHVHHREDEAFYVLEGEYQFLVGGETLSAEEGSLLYAPKGTLHAHKNVGEGVGRLLMIQTPGGLYELFFEKAGRWPKDDDDGVGPSPLEDRADAGRRIAKIAAEHGIEIPPPFTQ
jgi:mannose-6-phosphate isomerase-like protein (cupin superfamily)